LDQEQNQKNACFFVNRPKEKLYPDNHQPSYISTSFGATGIQKWLVQHPLSQKVRRYFSGINEEMLRPFLDCVGVDEPTLQPMQSCFKIDNICVFPFLHCGSLYTESPKIDNANEHLQLLSDAVVPVNAKGIVPEVIFRKTHKNDFFQLQGALRAYTTSCGGS
jgi:hypothetical protein